MPEYKNLTPFYDDEQVLCEFKLTFKESEPAVFLDASGDEITLSFPPDIPDEPINFDDYDFNIVGTDLIMSGPDVSVEGMKFNGNPISVYGLTPRDGCMAELQKGATRKSEIDGVFHTRDLELPFIMEADDVEDFLTKYYALMGYLLDTRYLTIDAFLVKQRYRVVYNAMSSLNEKGLVSLGDKIVFEIILSCYDDNPAQDNSISLFDGQFNINSQGELIYNQSDEFDERIGFKIIDGELIKVTDA